MSVVVIPAIDILGGRCVRLTQGDYRRAKVYAGDPVEVALGFAAAGAGRVHVVDLDAARGTGDNSPVIGAMLKHPELRLQVAGGIRTIESAGSLIDRGAHWVVMGTVAVTDPALFEGCARRHPERVLAALDVRDGRAAIAGWVDSAKGDVPGLLDRWNELPLGGVILTSIERDGTMSGPDTATLERVRRLTRLELHYSGGISSMEDVRRVAAAGADAVILGRAIYEGRITIEEALAP
jgi:phosphoribosylformimino-5-aminoimidazole carboxamide ribotide isomerase